MEALTQSFENALSGSPLLAFLLVYAAGVLTSFTPCVLPLFPVAVGTITSTARTREFVDGKVVDTVTHRGRALLMGLAYALGLASMFSLLGLLAALSGKAIFGALASSPAAYLILAALMLALGVWLWKGDRLDPGAWLQNWAYRGGETPGPFRKAMRWYMGTQGGGAATTFAFGFVSGILAGPCTAPVIMLVLTYVARAGAVAYGVGLMFVYALGLATLMVVAGMSATLAMRLKGKGNLAEWVKRGFALLMLVMTAYYLYQAAAFSGLFDEASGARGLYVISGVDKAGPPPVKAFAKGEILPDFRFHAVPEKKEGAENIDAEPPLEKKLSDFRGKVVYLPFWGIWCKECLAEIPLIKEFQAAHRDNERVALLSVNVLDDAGRVPAFLKEKGIDYSVIMDPDETLVERLGAMAFPLNLLLDPNGRIVYSGSAFPKDHRRLIDDLLKGKDVK